MKKITQVELNIILDKHKKWLNNKEDGEKADFSNTDLSYADFQCANLSYANFNAANLNYANFNAAQLSYTDLSNTDLSNSNLSNTYLEGTKLKGTNLKRANLENICLENTNFNNVKGLISIKEYMNKHFEFDKKNDGYIVYKVFGLYKPSPEHWIIKKGSVITEDCDMDRREICSNGINCATLDWFENHKTKLSIWKVFVKINNICIPYGTNGNIRCSKAKLLDIIK